MKTLKKMDKKIVAAIVAVIAAIALASLTACAMQTAGATEDLSIQEPIEAVEEAFAEDATEAAASDDPDDVTQDSNAQDNANEASAETRNENAQADSPVSGDTRTSQTGGNASAHQGAKASEHKHSWVPITEQHKVIDVAAYAETQYRTEECLICKVCNEDLTNGDKLGRSATEHGKAHTLAGQGGGCYSSTKRVTCGTIQHPEVSHYEDAIVGYKCSCGATK